MDLLKTIFLYLAMLYVSAVQWTPVVSTPSTVYTPQPVATVAAVGVAPTSAATVLQTPVPTPNITPNMAYKTIKFGDRGDLVKALQNRLIELGYYTGEADGAFGNRTRRAVERFQYHQGLGADGIAGKKTLTVLYESDAVVRAPQETTPAPVPTLTPKATPTPTVVPAPEQGMPVGGTVITFAPKPSQTPVPTFIPKSTAALPTLLPVLPAVQDKQTFVLSGKDEPMTTNPLNGDGTLGEPILLRPLQVGERIFVPFLEILKNAGITVVPVTRNEKQEVAFSVLKDIYQITYVATESDATRFSAVKNQKPQALSSQDAAVVDGIFYLPLDVAFEWTGISFTLDDTAGQYLVTLPDSKP